MKIDGAGSESALVLPLRLGMCAVISTAPAALDYSCYGTWKH
jgi:hypothetical protein